jgi:hypothetical protein
MTPQAVALALDVEALVCELKYSLATRLDEEALLTDITDRLAVLRRYFPGHKSSFNEGHIEFLKDVAGIIEPLKSFIGMKEELSDVGTICDYEALIHRLTDIKTRLAPYAVFKRVTKEIRQLNESLPAIKVKDEANRGFRITARIVEMERNPRVCGRKHAMVIRAGTRGYFWGCSRFPFCQETALLSFEERKRMGG